MLLYGNGRPINTNPNKDYRRLVTQLAVRDVGCFARNCGVRGRFCVVMLINVGIYVRFVGFFMIIVGICGII